MNIIKSTIKTRPYNIDMISKEYIYNQYKEAIDAYNNIINNVACLCRELKLNDPLKVSIVYSYLLWNGYFSENKEYNYSLSKRLIIPNYDGLSIMTGYGVCVNNVDMLNKVLMAGLYDADIIIVKQDMKMTRYDKPNIRRNIVEKDIFDKIKSYLIYKPRDEYFNNLFNHICNLINIDGNYYLYDPTNVCLYSLEDAPKGRLMGGHGYVELIALSCILANNLTLEDLKYLISQSNYNELTDIKLKDIFESNIALCHSNEQLFEDFYDANKPKIDVIVKKLKNHKNIY